MINMNGQDYIEDIKKRILNSDKEFALDGYAGSIDRLQKAFPRYSSFLMEFVQNADDAKSSSLKIEMLKDKIVISNNGIPFNEDNVKSICKVGRSSKTPEEYIGYLGVGFKSIFLISDSPEIYSGNFSFKFTKDLWEDPIHTPWQIIPIWINNPQITISDKYKTKFNIPLKNTQLVEKIKEEVTPSHLNNRILLFLRNIKKIEIVDSNENNKRIIKKSSNLSKTEEYEVYNIQEYENENLKTEDKWLIFKSPCTVPDNVRKDYVTKEWERDYIDKREVLVAFKLDEEDNLIIEKEGTTHIGVFSFLPLKEIPSGLNFLTQADFLTNPGRGDLARGCLWNEWLANEIYHLIIKKTIPSLLKNEKWKLNFIKILYSSEGGHELFEHHIKEPLREYLKVNNVLITEDGSTVKPNEAVSINSDVKALVNEKDLSTLYPGKKVVHSNCSVPWEIEEHIEKKPTFNASSGLSDKMKELFNIKTKEKNIEFFKTFFYRYLRDYKSSSPTTLSNLKSHNIFLTDDWNLTDANSVYLKPKDVKIPQQIKENLKVIHPELITEPEILEFLKILKINELTKEHIQSILKTGEIPKISKEWSTLSDYDKIEKIKLCKQLWDKDQVNARDLGFLTLKTKNGTWSNPEEIIFPKEYRPDHNIEIIAIEKRLYDLPIEYLNTVFIENVEKEKIKGWFNFFKELGIDKKVTDKEFVKNFVQRVGILTALKYEENEGRKPKELSRSEEIGGYDIISQEEIEGIGQITSGDRFIEVKGRRLPNPDIFLTSKQFKTLRDKRDKYYVYLVKDCLNYPTLCVTRGDKLIDITDTKIIIPFTKWRDEAKEDEYQP